MPNYHPLCAEIASSLHDEALPEIAVASLSLTRRFGDDHRHVFSYLTALTGPITTLEEIAAALVRLPDEEELSARWVHEGLLVSHASDGWFLLYVR